MTQMDLIREFFRNNADRDVPTAEVVDWLTSEYKKRTGKIFRDPDRGIRGLYQQGFLRKIKDGVYRHESGAAQNRNQENFSVKQKAEIMERDGYRCVICGARREDGVTLQVDHIKSREVGGKAEIENGQVLCSMHNYRKKNLGQTETGKKMFIRLRTLAKRNGDSKLVKFIDDILKTYDRHNINSHIKWKR